MIMIQRIKHFLFCPRFHFNRIQFNLIALLFVSLGLITGVYIALSDVIPRIFALNDTANTWTFNTANAGDFTRDSTLVAIDDNGAAPTGGTAGANHFANSDFAANNTSWSVGAAVPSGYVEVPGNATYGTTNFLAMQYGAKYDCTGDDDGNTAAECQSAGVCTAG